MIVDAHQHFWDPVRVLAAEYGDGLVLVGDDPRVLGETAIATYGHQVP